MKDMQKEMNEKSQKMKNYRSSVLYQQEECYIYEPSHLLNYGPPGTAPSEQTLKNV